MGRHCPIRPDNSVDFFSTGGGLFRQGVDFVETGVSTGDQTQILTDDIHTEKSVNLSVTSDQKPKSAKK